MHIIRQKSMYECWFTLTFLYHNYQGRILMGLYLIASNGS